MGMYDYISRPLAESIIKKCPMCSNTILNDDYSEWQTKDFSCVLQPIDVDDLSDNFEMHTICPHCHNYISLYVDMLNGTYNVYTNNSNSKGKFEHSGIVDQYNITKQTHFLNGLKNKIKDGFKTVSEDDLFESLKKVNGAYFVKEEFLYEIASELNEKYYIFEK